MFYINIQIYVKIQFVFCLVNEVKNKQHMFYELWYANMTRLVFLNLLLGFTDGFYEKIRVI